MILLFTILTCFLLDEAYADKPVLTLEVLKNAEYYPGSQRIHLNGGKYENTEETYEFLDAAFGDLNMDGLDDAAVLLVNMGKGGNAAFYDLCAVINEGGIPTFAAAAFLGDRIRVNEIDIIGGHIVIRMLTHYEKDGMCCPTRRIINEYRLREDIDLHSPTLKKARLLQINR